MLLQHAEKNRDRDDQHVTLAATMLLQHAETIRDRDAMFSGEARVEVGKGRAWYGRRRVYRRCLTSRWVASCLIIPRWIAPVSAQKVLKCLVRYPFPVPNVVLALPMLADGPLVHRS